MMESFIEDGMLDLNLSETSQTGSSQEDRDWSLEAIDELLGMPFNDLIFRAQQVHRAHFSPNAVQLSALLSIKTGGCPEDCAYCPQSARYNTGISAAKMIDSSEVLNAARAAKSQGATRFCMGAAWREPKDRDIEKVSELVSLVKELGLETCCTLGMLTKEHAQKLKTAGLDFYNHNLDTSPEIYGDIISTRAYQDRLDTLQHVQDAGLRVCSGGILGVGESRKQRAALIFQLASLKPSYPESVPINNLVRITGTPLEKMDPIEPFEFIRTIAAARITMPKAWVRLSAGREEMSDLLQALCFLAGANSVFYGNKLLVTGNPDWDRDLVLFQKLGLRIMA